MNILHYKIIFFVSYFLYTFFWLITGINIENLLVIVFLISTYFLIFKIVEIPKKQSYKQNLYVFSYINKHENKFSYFIGFFVVFLSSIFYLLTFLLELQVSISLFFIWLFVCIGYSYLQKQMFFNFVLDSLKNYLKSQNKFDFKDEDFKIINQYAIFILKRDDTNIDLLKEDFISKNKNIKDKTLLDLIDRLPVLIKEIISPTISKEDIIDINNR